jgi:hypothetical protein
MPLPVPPAMLCVRQKPSRLSAYPASRSAGHSFKLSVINPFSSLPCQSSSVLLEPPATALRWATAVQCRALADKGR